MRFSFSTVPWLTQLGMLRDAPMAWSSTAKTSDDCNAYRGMVSTVLPNGRADPRRMPRDVGDDIAYTTTSKSLWLFTTSGYSTRGLVDEEREAGAQAVIDPIA